MTQIHEALLAALASPADPWDAFAGFLRWYLDSGVARLAGLPNAGPVTPDIAILPPPLCQVLDALPASAVLAANDALAPRLSVGGDRGVYHDGETLLVTVGAPSAYDGYLYIGYIDGAEQIVIHLLPNDLRPDNHVIAGQQVVIGKQPPEAARYGFRPPYGTNLVIVLSTRTPLFDAPLSKFSELKQFLPKLALALQSQPDARLAYAKIIGAP